MTARPLEEVDGNVEMDSTGPTVKARSLKRKLTSPGDDESKGRSIARRLDFSRHTGSWTMNEQNDMNVELVREKKFSQICNGEKQPRTTKYETYYNYGK